MTEEKLKLLNDLVKQIEYCKDNIKKAKYTQAESVDIQKMELRKPGFTEPIIVPASLFRIIGKLILNEYQLLLAELQKEFEEL